MVRTISNVPEGHNSLGAINQKDLELHLKRTTNWGQALKLGKLIFSLPFVAAGQQNGEGSLNVAPSLLGIVWSHTKILSPFLPWPSLPSLREGSYKLHNRRSLPAAERRGKTEAKPIGSWLGTPPTCLFFSSCPSPYFYPILDQESGGGKWVQAGEIAICGRATSKTILVM